MLSLGPAGGVPLGVGGEGARRGGCFTGGGGACLGHPWPWWGFSLPWWAVVSPWASVAVVGLFFAPVGFSLPWWAVVSPWASVAVVGCYHYFKERFARGAVCLVGAGGTIPGGGPVYLCTLFYFPAVNFLIMAAVSMFFAS